MLAVIGDQWIEILKRRLDKEENDYVRIEIQAALKREIPVVPILVGEASVPLKMKLPPELSELAYKNAAEVRAGRDFQTHLRRLIKELDRLIAELRAEKEKKKRVAKEEQIQKADEAQKRKRGSRDKEKSRSNEASQGTGGAEAQF